MNLVRWDPFRELEEVSTRLNRLFNQPLGRRLIEDEGSLMAEWSPAVDVQETDGEYLIKADLPDVKKEDVRVEVQDGMLCLRGERQQEKEEKGKKFHRIGRRAESTPAEVGEREAEEHRGEGFVT
jgi:HSP20 family protein